MTKKTFDEIGYWSEIKLDIIREYAKAYSKIISRQKNPALYHAYIDAFAGAGRHVSEKTKKMVPGSPLIALETDPPFKEYHFIDIESAKIAELERMKNGQDNISVYEGDCNKVLLTEVFPGFEWQTYRRALCLLDPYGLHLDWEVISTAGHKRTMEIFLNFPVADINRNVLWNNPEKVEAAQLARMTRFWGDETWRDVSYSTDRNLFGYPEKNENEIIAEAFRQRLKIAAGFSYVPDPMPMRNSKGAVVYYLYFASQKPVAAKIIEGIFNKYRNRM